MKRSNPIISIPSPCHQNWDAMTPAQQGRYCGACQKTVIDFTVMTDGQILDVFNNAKRGSVCGHFHNAQLDRALTDNRYKPSFATLVAKRVAAIVLLFQSITIEAWSQQVRKHAPTTQQAGKKKQPIKAARQIKGRVVDFICNTSVEGIKVEVRGANIYSFTDKTGAFVLNIPDTLQAHEIIVESKSPKDSRFVFKKVAVNIKNPGRVIILERQERNNAKYEKALTAEDIKHTSTGGAVDIVAQTPGIYQQKRGGAVQSHDSTKMLGVVDNSLVLGDNIADMSQEIKPSLWQRITKPFRKKHTTNEAK